MENTDITTPKETEKKLDEDSSYRIVYIEDLGPKIFERVLIDGRVAATTKEDQQTTPEDTEKIKQEQPRPEDNHFDIRYTSNLGYPILGQTPDYVREKVGDAEKLHEGWAKMQSLQAAENESVTEESIIEENNPDSDEEINEQNAIDKQIDIDERNIIEQNVVDSDEDSGDEQVDVEQHNEEKDVEEEARKAEYVRNMKQLIFGDVDFEKAGADMQNGEGIDEDLLLLQRAWEQATSANPINPPLENPQPEVPQIEEVKPNDPKPKLTYKQKKNRKANNRRKVNRGGK